MRLDTQVKKQVEAVLKSPVPPPTDPEFDELLLRLRKENPELAQLLESGVIFDDLPTPDEETARAVSRRSSLLSLKHILLDRYDELTGEWVPSRPKQIALGFVGLIAATSLWFALSTRETGPAKGGLPVQAATPSSPTVTVQPEPAQTAPQAAQPQDSAPAPAAAEPSTGGAAPAESNPATASGQAYPPPPSGYSEVPPPPSGYPASSGYATGTSGTANPQSPQAAPPPPPPLTVYTQSPQPAATAGTGSTTSQPAPSAPLSIATAGAASGTGSQPLTLASRSAPAAAGSSSRPLTGSVADDVAASLQGQPVPSAQAQAQSAQAGGSLTLKKETQSTFAVRQVEGQGGQGGSFYLVGGNAQAQSPAVASAPPQAQPTFSVPPNAAFPSAPSGQPSGPAQAQAAPTPPAAPYSLGTRLRGRLGVGVLIAEGTPGAVAIDAEDGSTWVGEVTLDETRRLKGKLIRVIKDGREYATHATLLDEAGTLGVAAAVREEAPSIAADLIRGSLRGVSDYVTAASQAKSVTVLPGGGVAQSSQTPPLGLFMAGSLANLFALQQDKKAVVRVAQAEKGTEVVILVVPDQSPAGK